MAGIELITAVAEDVVVTVVHTWPYVVLGIISAAALKVYVGTDRLAALFRRRTGAAVSGSVVAAVATPFCSCGTTAVVLSMLATAVPWAPVVAFMVASPLTSPDELLLSAGFFGWPFAWFFMAASVVLGLAGGAVAFAAEHAGLLDHRARFARRSPPRRRPCPSRPAWDRGLHMSASSPPSIAGGYASSSARSSPLGRG